MHTCTKSNLEIALQSNHEFVSLGQPQKPIKSFFFYSYPGAERSSRARKGQATQVRGLTVPKFLIETLFSAGYSNLLDFWLLTMSMA